MVVYAYLRVSTNQHDADNERYSVLIYANTQDLGPLQCVADTASGRLAWQQRVVSRDYYHPPNSTIHERFQTRFHVPLQELHVL
jgi:hypothetical protein